MSPMLPWIAFVVLMPPLAQEPDRETKPESEATELGDESTRAIDSRVRRSVVRAMKEGVVLFNDRGDPAGCYRLYQGALIGIEPLLDHRPQLQFALGTGLDRAAELADGNVSRAAFELRGLLDRAYEELKGGSPGGASLWERLGGEDAVRALVHDFVALAAGDEEVDFFREGRYATDDSGVARLEQLMVEFLSEATGGPLEYTGRPMGPSHEGMGISDAEFNALAADLVAVLRKYEIPQDAIDELLAIVATTREDIVEEDPLWDRLGGEEAVRAVVDDFVQRTARNPEVNFTRDGRYPLDEAGIGRMKERIVQFLSEATGGPLEYEGDPMGPVHRGMGITGAEFDAMTADLVASLRAAEVPRELIDELTSVVARTRARIVEER